MVLAQKIGDVPGVVSLREAGISFVQKGSRLSVDDPTKLTNWNNGLGRFKDASIFHTSEWCHILKDSYGYKPFYLVLNRDGERQAILHILEVDRYFLGRHAVSLPFTDQCSFLSHGNEGFFDAVGTLGNGQFRKLPQSNELCSELVSIARQRRWKSLEIRDGSAVLPASREYCKHLLDLTPGPARLMQNLDGSTRRALKKAQRSGLSVKVEHTLEAVKEFYQLHCQTRKHHGLPPQPFSFFENIFKFLIVKKLGCVISAWQGSTAVASAMFLQFGKTAYFKFGASAREFQNLRGNNLIMWEAIEFLAFQGCESLDFGRTVNENAGLRRFKTGWGATESRLAYSCFDFEKKVFRKELNRETGWYNTAFRLLPISVGKKIGETLYRFIG